MQAMTGGQQRHRQRPPVWHVHLWRRESLHREPAVLLLFPVCLSLLSLSGLVGRKNFETG